MYLKKQVFIAILAILVVLGLSGCGAEDEEIARETYPVKPTLTTNSITVTDGGAEIVWDITVDNIHEKMNVSIAPFNDVAGTEVGVTLDCNAALESNGQTRYCNDIEKIICTRKAVYAKLSTYECSYEIGGVRYIPFYGEIRMRTTTLDASGDDLLYTIGTGYIGSDGYYAKVIETNTSLMFNAYTSDVNQP